MDKVRQIALAKLQQTEKYQNEYLPALNKDSHYGRKIEGLGRARDFVVFQSYRFDSETEAMLAEIDSMDIGSRGKPSASVLYWSHDLTKIEEEVKQELQRFIIDGMVERIENVMPEYR